MIDDTITSCYIRITRSFCYSNLKYHMMLKNKRKIQSRTARAMLTWSHFRFRMFLLHKIREYKYCKVIECTEEYTSKTCGHCGQINNKLGSSKTFRCDSCKVEMDWDANGVRNILLKFLTEGQVLAWLWDLNLYGIQYD